MSELYTIDKTPQTELEKFQALRIEALERELEKLRNLNNQATEIFKGMVKDANEIEVNEPLIINQK